MKNKTEKVQSKNARQVCDRENMNLIHDTKSFYKKEFLKNF